jgi:hypothetical protein
LKAPADIHPGTQKQELAPNTSQPCQSPYKVALKRWRCCASIIWPKIHKGCSFIAHGYSLHVCSFMLLCIGV